MSLEGSWPVYEGGRQVGTCTVARQGLYLRFDCRCGPADGRILRLVLRSASGDVSLGIPAPENGILQLRKGIPAKRLPQEDEFRLELLDSRYPRDGRFIEEIGYYDPTKEPTVVNLDADKAKTWLKNGAQPTDTVKVILKKEGVL